MKEPEPRKQFQIAQVAATMAIEDMPIDRQTHKHLTKIAVGEKSADQIISEIKRSTKMADVYCYPDSSALKNKLDIHNKERLLTAETRLAAIRL